LLAVGSFACAAAFAPTSSLTRAVVTVRHAHEAKASATTQKDLFQTVIADGHVTDASQTKAISPFSPRKRGLYTRKVKVSVDKVTNIPIAPRVSAFNTWKRRLDTNQDPFNVHKWAGLGWLLSSTVIFGAGAMSGFTIVPDMLGPITYIFLVSTVIQSLSSIPMAIKYRRNEPSMQRSFISSAITSSSLAWIGYWLSPFAKDALRPDLATGFIALLVFVDAIYSISSYGDMMTLLDKIKEIDPIKGAQSLREKYTYLIGTFPVGLPMNAFLLQQMYTHLDDVRGYLLDNVTHRGSSSELVFYALLVTSIAASVANLAATLSHRKLISKKVVNLATIGSVVVTLIFNLRAAGTF
jgi:hypothetical protein